MKLNQLFFAILLFMTTQTFTQASDHKTSHVKWDGVEIETAAPKKEYSVPQINQYLRENYIPAQVDKSGQIWIGLMLLENKQLASKIKNKALTSEDVEKIRSIFTTTKSKL